MRVDAMTRGDVDEVSELVSTSFDPRLSPYMTSAQSGAALFLDSFVQYSGLRRDRCYRVARSAEGTLLGYADFRLTGDRSSFLSYIAVASESRGRGVAGRIMDSFLAEHPYVDSMELDVFLDNVAARTLYEKRGFAIAGEAEWWVRPPPQPSRVPEGWTLDNAADVAAWRSSFGFCEYNVDTGTASRKFGQIGPDTLKCYSSDDFGDDEFLSAVATIVPGVRRIFYIGSSDLGPPTSDCKSVNTSLRMICRPLRNFGA